MITDVCTYNEKAAPQVSHSVKSLDNGHHVVKFVSIDQSLDPGSIKWRLIPDGGNVTQGLTGYVADEGVYGVVGANISYHDRDAGYTVSAGDYFVINSAELGSDNGGWKKDSSDDWAYCLVIIFHSCHDSAKTAKLFNQTENLTFSIRYFTATKVGDGIPSPA